MWVVFVLLVPTLKYLLYKRMIVVRLKKAKSATWTILEANQLLSSESSSLRITVILANHLIFTIRLATIVRFAPPNNLPDGLIMAAIQLASVLNNTLTYASIGIMYKTINVNIVCHPSIKRKEAVLSVGIISSLISKAMYVKTRPNVLMNRVLLLTDTTLKIICVLFVQKEP